MDIRCERCATEYELEDAQIPDAGVTIKCSTCGHVFKAMRPSAPSGVLALRLFRGGAPVSASCPDGATLQRWIIEQRVLRDDEVSSGGQAWRRVSEVAEFAPFFALLSMPPPVSRPTTGTMTAPSMPVMPPPTPTPSPSWGGPLAAQQPTPTPRWTAPIPSTPTPPPSWTPSGVTGSTPSFPRAPVPDADDTARTVQIQITPDMFGPPPTAAPASLGTPLSTPHLSSFFAPSPNAATTGLDGATTPSLPAAPAATMAMAPAQVAALGQRPTPLQTPAAPRPPAPAPRPSPAAQRPKAGATKRPDADHDAELAAFVNKGRGTRIAIAAVVVVGIVGALIYLALPEVEAHRGPSAKAKAAFDKGRELYLTDTLSQFPAAEGAYNDAIADMGKGGYPAAEGALAELHAAWAEQILNSYNVLAADVKTKTADGKTDEAKALIPTVNELSSQWKGKLGELFSEVNTLRSAHEQNLEADRALLDYYRVMTDQKSGSTLVEQIRTKKDPETRAHVAAWDAMDATKVSGAEAALIDVTVKMPNLVRARAWLAMIHDKAGNVAAETSDMEAILKLAPDHAAAKAFLQAHTASAGGTTTAVAPGKAEAVKEPTAPPKKETVAPPAGGNLPRKEDPRKKADDGVKEVNVGSGSSIDVDKAIDQAGRFLDKKKPAKALELYEKVLAAKPTLSDALYGRGLALYDLGKTSEAIDAFRKTLEVNHRFGDAMIGIAEAYKKKAQNKDAVKYYKQYLDMYPTGEQAAVARANVENLK